MPPPRLAQLRERQPAEDAGQAPGHSGWAVTGVTGLRDIRRNTEGPQLYRFHRSDIYQGGQVLPSSGSLSSPGPSSNSHVSRQKGQPGKCGKTQVLPWPEKPLWPPRT